MPLMYILKGLYNEIIFNTIDILETKQIRYNLGFDEASFLLLLLIPFAITV